MAAKQQSGRGTDRPLTRQNLVAWICAGLAAAVLLLYGQSARFDFVTLDDPQYVSQNPEVKQGLTAHGVGWAFTTAAEGNWHPLTWLSHMLDVELFGLEPGAHHMTNVVLHALNAALLLVALLLLGADLWPSILVAALFAIHPLRVESVAWISERKDVLSGCFWMLGLAAYGWYVRRPDLRRYLLVVGAMALGLMSKPMVVTLPFVLLLLDVWPLGRWKLSGPPPLKIVLEKLPLLALSAASCVVTVLHQRIGGSVQTLESVPLGARVANALVSYVVYLGKTVVPTGLAVLYPHPALVARAGTGALTGWGVAAGVGLVVATGIILFASRRRAYLGVGWLWFLGTLVPVIGFVQVGGQARADRYAYLPLIGIYVIVAWGLRDASSRWPASAAVLRGVFGVWLVVLAVLTFRQVGTWKNSETLYRRALAVTESNYIIHNNLGTLLPTTSPEAEAEYRSAIAIKPDYADAHYNLGVVLQDRGDLAAAATEYEQALRWKPNWMEPRNNLAVVRSAQGDSAGVLAQWEELVRLQPESAEAHHRLGMALEEQGNRARAVSEFEAAVRLDSREPRYLASLADARQKQGDLAGASKTFEAAARSDPQNLAAEFNLGIIEAKQGKLAEAQSRFERLLRANPDEPQLHSALGAVLAQQEKYAEAEAQFEEALRLAPDFDKAREGLDKVRRLRGR